jgi:hypothetical protein
MPSVKIEGSITLPDGRTTGPFVLNIPLLPPVRRPVEPTVGPAEQVPQPPEIDS